MGVAVGGLGVFGLYPSYYASFIAMLLGPIIYIPLTMATRGKYYEPPVSTEAPTIERTLA
jgi:hypothetical protein